MKRSRYDGLVSTEYLEGTDGTCAMRMRVAPTAGTKLLVGWGHDETSSAADLVRQLRLYADWMARRYGLTVLGDEAALQASIVLRNGKDDL